jgi:membrane AbrB-like protein
MRGRVGTHGMIPKGGPLAIASIVGQWASLILLAFVFTWVLVGLDVVGASFQAPLLAGLAFAMAGSPLRMRHEITVAAQGVIGCIVARSLGPAILTFLGHHAFGIIVLLLATAAASLFVAWGLIRFRVLDAESAAWASMPGASAMMVALAAERGADARAVAAMQYLRLIIVVATATSIASLLTAAIPSAQHVTAQGAGSALAFMPVQSFWAIVIIIVGITIGKLSRVPAGPLLFTTVVAFILRHEGFEVVVPDWMRIAAYGGLGLFIGLQFDRANVVRIARKLPAMILGIIVMMVLCALSGFAFAWYLGVSPLTGFLATSPGGIDSIAILASGAHADMSIVMTFQSIRFFALIMAAPWLVRLAKRAERSDKEA